MNVTMMTEMVGDGDDVTPNTTSWPTHSPGLARLYYGPPHPARCQLGFSELGASAPHTSPQWKINKYL